MHPVQRPGVTDGRTAPFSIGFGYPVGSAGKAQLPISVTVMTMGGYVRVGMEDGIYYSKGVLAETNAQFVELMGRIAHAYGRDPASPAEARRILGIG